MAALATLGETVNKVLGHANVQIVHARTTNPSVSPFISARRTIAEARRANAGLGDYIDAKSRQSGATTKTVATILRLAELDGRPGLRICEIGPGSGRYAEKIIAALHPVEYQVYESAGDWLPRLRTLPQVVIQRCDGRHLAGTSSGSIDLVHADKVFVYVPFHVTLSYLDEMSRVVRIGGTVAFDVVTERCLDKGTVDEWIRDGTIYTPAPRRWTIRHLASRGLRLMGSELIPMTGHHTELLVFRKES
jgi:hypothetical protein